MNMKPNARARILLGAAPLMILSLGGCFLTPPDYDDQTDKMITQLQTDVDTEIVTLISLDHKIGSLAQKTDEASQKALADAKTKAAFDANGTFYDKVDVDLIGLQTRVDAEPNAATQHLDVALKDLRSNLLGTDASMRLLHQADGILTEDKLGTVQKLVDAQIGALLTYELQLKNGSSSSGGSTGTGSTGGSGKTASN